MSPSRKTDALKHMPKKSKSSNSRIQKSNKASHLKEALSKLKQSMPEVVVFNEIQGNELNDEETVEYAATQITSLKRKLQQKNEENEALKTKLADNTMEYSNSLVKITAENVYYRSLIKKFRIEHEKDGLTDIDFKPPQEADPDCTHLVHDALGRQICTQCGEKLLSK